MASELDGRALAEAAARAMGWRSWHDGPVAMAMGPGWVEPDGTIHGVTADGGPDIPERECLAWLHTKGKVHTSSESDWCYTRLLFRPSLTESVCAGGATMLEALQRLVVAVAAREQAAKGEP